MGLGQGDTGIDAYKRVIVNRETAASPELHHPDCHQETELTWLCYKDCEVRASAEVHTWTAKRAIGLDEL